MNVLATMNSDYLQKQYEYGDTNAIAHELTKRGHQVYIGFAEHVDKGHFTKAILYDANQRYRVVDNPRPDLILLRMMGQNVPGLCDTFLSQLFLLEKNYRLINTANAAQFHKKDLQKTLPIPTIPSIDATCADELYAATPFIAKPKSGFMSAGIFYCDTSQSVDDFLQKTPGAFTHYLFEEYIDADDELRLVFLGDECILARHKFFTGSPGKQIEKDYALFKPTKEQLDIMHTVREHTGMELGTVDFRKNFVLEINGSGVGVLPYEHCSQLYDLTNPIVEYVLR